MKKALNDGELSRQKEKSRKFNNLLSSTKQIESQVKNANRS